MSDFSAAAAAQILGAAADRRALLASIVEVARAIFRAEASSIALLDERAGDFVFAAVAGQGEGSLEGIRFRAGTGLAGSVAQSGEPLIIDDLSRDPRFARNVAEDTGYVPNAMMVAPLLRGEDVLGTLSVLDRGETGRNSLEELQLLCAFADQAALAVGLIEGEGDLAVVARLVERLQAADDERREAGLGLLAALERLLG
jgi:GAF domain-containing protein